MIKTNFIHETGIYKIPVKKPRGFKIDVQVDNKITMVMLKKLISKIRKLKGVNAAVLKSK